MMLYNMKIRCLFRVFLCVWTFLYISVSMAQENEIIARFDVELLNEKVYLDFTIKSGNTCNGIGVLRSTDSTNFDQIYKFNGICGSSSISIDYNYTDVTPEKNKVNYYQLDLADFGFSSVKSILVIDLNSESYFLKGNPLINESILYFNNPNQSVVELKIINHTGKSVYSQITKENFFHLERSVFESGIYYFEIRREGGQGPIYGKVIVL